MENKSCVFKDEKLTERLDGLTSNSLFCCAALIVLQDVFNSLPEDQRKSPKEFVERFMNADYFHKKAEELMTTLEFNQSMGYGFGFPE